MEEIIQRVVKMMRRGYSKDKILKSILHNNADEIYEIAKCRIKIKDKFSKKNLYFDLESLRYSTPEIVGMYRASKIKNMKIADVSCGSGMQAIFFAMTNEFVLGLDIDERRIKYARKNAKVYGVENIEFRVMDALSRCAVESTKGYDIIYSDPARPSNEKERKLENLLPSPIKIIEKYGERNYIFDLPPQINRKKLPESWNLEYISLNHRINRLTSYINDNSDGLRIATTLPSQKSIKGYGENSYSMDNVIGNYIYEVDEAVYYAGLLGELQRNLGDIWYLAIGKRRTLASSYKYINNYFLRGFEIMGISSSLKQIMEILKEEGFGKVTLRMSIKPERYWKFRKNIEDKLKGDKKAYLFKINEKYVLGREITQ